MQTTETFVLNVQPGAPAPGLVDVLIQVIELLLEYLANERLQHP